MQSHLFEFSLLCGFQESKRSNQNSSSSVSDVAIEAKFLTSSLRRRSERSLSVFILRFSSQLTRIFKSSWKYFPICPIRRPVLSLFSKRHDNFTIPSLCMKEPPHLTKYSFALELDDVKRDNSYHSQCKI